MANHHLKEVIIHKLHIRCQEVVHSSQNQKTRCKRHQREMCGECLDIPSQSNAALHLRGTEVMFDCGCRIPVIADACKSGLERMPVIRGWIGDRNVSVLRDTGCSTCCDQKEFSR